MAKEKDPKKIAKDVTKTLIDNTADAKNIAAEFIQELSKGGKQAKAIFDQIKKQVAGLADQTTNATNAMEDYAAKQKEAVKNSSVLKDITKQLSTYDGPRFKASGLITEELSNQLSASKFIIDSKNNINDLEERSIANAELLNGSITKSIDLTNQANDLKSVQASSEQKLLDLSNELLITEGNLTKQKDQLTGLDERLIKINEKKIKLQSESSDLLSKENDLLNQIQTLEKDSEKNEDKLNSLRQEALGLYIQQLDIGEKLSVVANLESAAQQQANDLILSSLNLEQQISDKKQEQLNLSSELISNADQINKLEQAASSEKSLDAIREKIQSSEQLRSVFESLNDITNQQKQGQSDLAAKMLAVEKSAIAVGTAQYYQVDLLDDINDKISESNELEEALAKIKDENNGLTGNERALLEANIQANIKINQEQTKQLQALQAASEAYATVNDKAEALRDSMMAPVDKLFGIVPSGLSKMLGLDKIQSEMKDKLFKSISDGFMGASGGVSGFFSAASAGAGTLMTSLLPILPLLLAIAGVVGLVKLFMNADAAVGQLAKDLGVSYNEAIKIQGTATNIATEMNVVGLNTAEVTKQMVDLKAATGLNFGILAETNDKAKALLETSSMLSTTYGTTVEENLALNSAAAITGTTLDKMALTAMDLGDEFVSSGELIKDIGKVSKGVLFNFKGNVKALALAVKQAKLMGVTLDQVAASGDKLMDIESSVTAENKARLILGRDINMNAARYYAMTGQTEKQMAEMKKQAGTLANYEKMGPIQRRALADALGMSNDELAGMMAKEKELQSMGIDEKKLNEILTKDKEGQLDLQSTLNGLKDDEAREMLKAKLAEQQRAGIQEKLASTIQKVTDLLYKMVEPILPIIDDFVKSLGDGKSTLAGISSVFSTVGDVLANVIMPVAKIAFAPMRETITIVRKIIEKVGGALKRIFGETDEGASGLEGIGNVLSTIGDVLGKVFSGIGAFISVYILRPFMLVADLVGGFVKIFKGDIKGGLKEIGGAILSFMLAPFEAVGAFIDEVFGTNLVDSVTEIFSNIGDAIIDILGGAWDVIAGIFTLDGDRILDGIKSIGKGLYNALVQPFMDAWDWITGFFGGNSPSKLGESIVVGISSVAESLFDFITYPFKKAWDFIGNLFGMGDLGNSIIDGFKDVFSEVGDMIMEYISGAWNIVSGIFTLDGDKILEGLKGVGNAIVSMITYPFEKAMNLIGKLFGVKELGSSIIKSIKSFGKKVIDIIKMPFIKAVDWISETFGGIGGKLIDGISNIASNIWNFITTPFKKAYEWITGLFGGTGKKIIEGISNLATDVYSSVTGAFKSGYDWVINSFSNIGQKIADGISSVGGSIVNSITSPFTEAWDSISSWLGASPSELGNSIVKGISSVSGDVESNLTKPFDSAEQRVSKSASAMADSVSGISGNASMSISGIDTAGISQIKDISDEDLARIQQIASVSGNSGSSGLSSMISNLFGGSSDDEETNTVSASTPKPTATAAPITPVMQPVASVNTQPIVQTNQTINTDNNQPNFKNVEALLKELISKVEQPVILKIGEKAISDMQSVMSLKKSYSSNVNGYRA
jgi:hypothetical protein